MKGSNLFKSIFLKKTPESLNRTLILSKNMKRIFVLSILMILSLSTFVVAEKLEDLLLTGTEDLSGQERIDVQKTILVENVDLLALEINSNIKSLPGVLKTVLGNTEMNLYFDSGEVIGIVLEDAQVVSIDAQGLEDPTFDVYISDAVFENINTGELDVKKALQDGDIRYEGRGFWGNMKSAMLTAGLKVLGL